MENEFLSVTDRRTQRTYELPLYQGTLRAMDLRQIKASREDFGLMSYDPALMNTACWQSAITFIDGDQGILRYRGYPIEQLAEHCSFLEVAWLLLYGDLPDRAQLGAWLDTIAGHSMIQDDTRRLLEGFPPDAQPAGMLISAVAALSALDAETWNFHHSMLRRERIAHLIGQLPAIAAHIWRRALGHSYICPDPQLGYIRNFMHMLWDGGESSFAANPILAHALEKVFILHADHEQNCGTNVMRSVGSAGADPYLATAAAAAALSGPQLGGLSRQVLAMLDKIGSRERVPSFVEEVKAAHGRLPGFGHTVYRNYDPRARIAKTTAEEIIAVTGRNPRLEIALELDRIALEDEYFSKRKLYPNVDFYSGLIYEAMGFPPEMLPVLFAIPRAVGWLAQWEEMLADPEQKIVRPRQIYTGHPLREWQPAQLAEVPAG